MQFKLDFLFQLVFNSIQNIACPHLQYRNKHPHPYFSHPSASSIAIFNLFTSWPSEQEATAINQNRTIYNQQGSWRSGIARNLESLMFHISNKQIQVHVVTTDLEFMVRLITLHMEKQASYRLITCRGFFSLLKYNQYIYTYIYSILQHHFI